MSKVNTGQASSTLIPKYIGSDFDKVVAVADNIEQVVVVGDNIEDVGTVADNINYVKEVAEDLHGMPVTMYTGETPPVLNPMPEGVMWYCTTDGRTYVWYADSDSGQWVESAPQSALKDEATNIFLHSVPSNVNPAYRSATLHSTPSPEVEISVAHNALNTPVVQAQFIREEALWVDVSVTGAQGIVTLMGYSSGNSQLKAEIITWKNGAEGTSLGTSQWVTLPNQPSVVSLPVTLANIDVLDAGDSYVVKLTSQMNAGGSAISTILVDGTTSSRFGIIFNTRLIGLFDGIRDGVTTSAPTENAVYDALQLKADKTEVSDALQLKVGKSQLSQSGNLTSTANWADVPAYSDSELGGLGGLLNAQAKALTARSELLLTDVREALRRSYAEAGYSLVDGSFEDGGTLTSATDVLLHGASGKAYSGAGPYPQTVVAGTNPVSGGFTDRSTILLRQLMDGLAVTITGEVTSAQFQAAIDLATSKNIPLYGTCTVDATSKIELTCRTHPGSKILVVPRLVAPAMLWPDGSYCLRVSYIGHVYGITVDNINFVNGSTGTSFIGYLADARNCIHHGISVKRFPVNIQCRSFSNRFIECFVWLGGTGFSAYGLSYAQEINSLVIDGGAYIECSEYNCFIGDTRFATSIADTDWHGLGVQLVNMPKFDGGHIKIDRVATVEINAYFETPSLNPPLPVAIDIGTAGAPWVEPRGVTIHGCVARNFNNFVKCNVRVDNLNIQPNSLYFIYQCGCYLTTIGAGFVYETQHVHGAVTFKFGTQVHTGLAAGTPVGGFNQFRASTIAPHNLFGGIQNQAKDASNNDRPDFVTGTQLIVGKDDRLLRQYIGTHRVRFGADVVTNCTADGTKIVTVALADIVKFNGGDVILIGATTTYIRTVDYTAGIFVTDADVTGTTVTQTQGAPHVSGSSFSIPTMKAMNGSFVTNANAGSPLGWRMINNVWTAYP